MPVQGSVSFPSWRKEAFTGLAGDIVRAVAPHTESDPVGLLLSAHVFFGNCIGRGPHCKVEAPEHGTTPFVGKVCDSSQAGRWTGEDRVLAFDRRGNDGLSGRRLTAALRGGDRCIWVE